MAGGPISMFMRRRSPAIPGFNSRMEDFQLPNFEEEPEVESPDMSRPMFEAYQEHSANMPDMEQLKPSVGRRILAALAGALTGGPAGFELAQRITHDKGNRALQDWQMEGQQLRSASEMEEKGLQEQVNLFKEKVGARDRDLDRRVKQGEVSLKLQEVKNNYEKMLREATSEEEANAIRAEWNQIQGQVMRQNAGSSARQAGASELNARANMMRAETDKARPPKELGVESPQYQMDAEFMATQYLANTMDNPEQFFEQFEDDNGNQYWKVRGDLDSMDKAPLARRIRDMGQGILYKR